MDKTSYEEIEKGKRNFIIIVLVVLSTIGIITGLFTTYKTETLICSKKNDTCVIEKTNLINIKQQNELVKISNIANVTYIPQRVAGNMYAQGYSSYYLAFNTKDKQKIKVFSIDYYEKEVIDAIISELRSKLKNSQDTFKIEQKL